MLSPQYAFPLTLFQDFIISFSRNTYEKLNRVCLYVLMLNNWKKYWHHRNENRQFFYHHKNVRIALYSPSHSSSTWKVSQTNSTHSKPYVLQEKWKNSSSMLLSHWNVSCISYCWRSGHREQTGHCGICNSPALDNPKHIISENWEILEKFRNSNGVEFTSNPCCRRHFKFQFQNASLKLHIAPLEAQS